MARKFQFRLDSLLRVRRLREQTQQRTVAAAAAVAIQAQSRRDAVQRAMAEQMELLRAQTSEPNLAVDDAIAARAWLGRLRRDWLTCQADLVRQYENLTAAQQLLAVARRETKVLDRLRDRRLADHRLGVEREEIAVSDERTLARWGRERSAIQ